MFRSIITIWTAALTMSFVLAANQTIKSIIVRGNENISDEAIRSVLSIKEGEHLQQEALVQDERVVQDLGFFKNVKVTSKEVSSGECEVIIDVEENPIVKDFRVECNTVICKEEVIAAAKKYQQVGEVYNLRNALPISNAITELYQAGGYYAQVDLKPDLQSPTTLVLNVIETTVSSIDICGLKRTNEKVVRKLIKTRPGDPFNVKTLDGDRRRLNSTQWFEDVSTRGQECGDNGNLDLTFDLKESYTSQFRIGATKPLRGGIAGTVAYSNNNFLGEGKTLAGSLQYTIKGHGLSGSIDYLDPFFRYHEDDDSHDVTFSCRLFTQVNANFTTGGFGAIKSPTGDNRFDERRSGASVNFSHSINPQAYYAYGISYQNIKTINVPNSGTDFIQQDGNLVTLNGQYALDTRDVRLDPREGYVAKVQVEPGFGSLNKVAGFPSIVAELGQGSFAFVRSTAEYKYFVSSNSACRTPIDKPIPVFAVRAKVGTIQGDVPFFEQFFLGGFDTIRGYRDQRFWGKHMFLSGAEYRYPLHKSFYVFPFLDLGTAWGGYPSINDFTQSNKPSFKLGGGAGASFRTPVGPIRIMFGWGDEKLKFRKPEIHFTIGTGGW